MTDSRQTESALGGLVPGAVATSALREAEAWTRAQSKLASGIGVIWTDW